MIALAVIGTALAQILLYRVLRSDGAARVSLVTYLLPVTALFAGVLLLGEPLTWEELAGMVLILGGVALGSGAVRFARREPVARPRRERHAAAGRAARRRLPARADDPRRRRAVLAVIRPRDREGCWPRSSARRPSPRSTAAS